LIHFYLIPQLSKINSFSDVGQIEGAFMQGLGYVTTEQLLRSRETGELLSMGPGKYKVFECDV